MKNEIIENGCTTPTSQQLSDLQIKCAELLKTHEVHRVTRVWISGQEPEDGLLIFDKHSRESHLWNDNCSSRTDLDFIPIPRYASSYNAILPEIKNLNWKQKSLFVIELINIMGNRGVPLWLMFEATAWQLTEALIRTLSNNNLEMDGE